MKKSTLAIATLLATLSAAAMVPAAYADDSATQQTTTDSDNTNSMGSTGSTDSNDSSNTGSGDDTGS